MSSLLLDSSCRDQVAQARTQSAILVNSHPLTSILNPSAGSVNPIFKIDFKSVHLFPPPWPSLQSSHSPLLPGVQSLLSLSAPLSHPPSIIHSLCTVTRVVLSFKRRNRDVSCSCTRAPSSGTAPVGPDLASLRPVPLGYSQYMPFAK